MRTEHVSIAVPGANKPMPAYLALPDGAAPGERRPAVLVLEEIFGVNSHIRDVTERFAREGYVALAPDYHHRHYAGEELGYDQDGFTRGMERIGKLTEAGALADVNAALGFLRARDDVDASRIGCIGFCIGGHVAYLTATATDVRATASFYGGMIATSGLGGAPAPLTRTGSIRGRILCLFGGQDRFITPEQVDAIRRELEAKRVRHEVVVYQDADHGFFCDQRGSYHAGAAADAWARVKQLFAEELRG